MKYHIYLQNAILLLVFSYLAIYVFSTLPHWVSESDEQLVTLDDVSPATISDTDLRNFLNSHQGENVILFVTPYFAGTNISLNPNWLAQVKSLHEEYDFELGLHGYTHRLFGLRCDEFTFPAPNKIAKAREEFKRAFGYYPLYFRAPCFNFNIVDYIYIDSLGMKNFGYYKHGKVYHTYELKTDWDTLKPSLENEMLN